MRRWIVYERRMKKGEGGLAELEFGPRLGVLLSPQHESVVYVRDSGVVAIALITDVLLQEEEVD